MEEALNFVVKWGGLLALILIPIWPLLALPAGVFSEGIDPFMNTPSHKPSPLMIASCHMHVRYRSPLSQGSRQLSVFSNLGHLGYLVQATSSSGSSCP